MPIQFLAKLDSVLEQIATGMKRGQITAVMKDAAIEVSRFWIDNYLDLHFENAAYSRYRYNPRTARWNAIKRRARRIKVPGRPGVFIRAEQPPKPNVWTGRMRAAVVGRKRLLRAKATQRYGSQEAFPRVRVRIVIPIPHPINKKHRREIGRISPAENRAFQVLFLRSVRRRIRELKRAKEGAR